jgi:hypothetical protein
MTGVNKIKHTRPACWREAIALDKVCKCPILERVPDERGACLDQRT